MHYYHYYRHRYAPKVDVRIVMFILISVISAIQYYGQYSNYHTAIDYLVTQPKYRIQAQAIARQEGLIDATSGDSSKKTRGRTKMTKQEEDAIIRQIVEQNLDIKGGYQKPSKASSVLVAAGTSSFLHRHQAYSLVAIAAASV